MTLTSTEYTKKMFSDFATYTVKKNKAMKIIYVCAAIIIVCSIILICLGDYTRGIIYAVLGVLFALYGVLMRFLITLSNKKNIGTVDIYEFDDTKFSIKIRSKDGKEMSSSSINYEALHSIETYKDYAYIYINKVTAYIICKQNFATETDFENVVKTIKSGIPAKVKN